MDVHSVLCYVILAVQQLQKELVDRAFYTWGTQKKQD